MAITTDKVYRCECDICGFTKDIERSETTRYKDVMQILRSEGWRVSYNGKKCTCSKCAAHYGGCEE